MTKGVVGGEVLVAPGSSTPTAVNRLGRVGGALPLVTDGAFFPDGRHVVLRNYGRAIVYTCPELEEAGR